MSKAADERWAERWAEGWNDTPDRFVGDLAVGPLYADRPPTRGLAGWVDWRLGEPVAEAILNGRVKAQPGERFLIAGRPPFNVPRIVLLGVDAPVSDPALLPPLADLFADALRGLGGGRVLVEPPATDAPAFLRLLQERLEGLTCEILSYVPEEPCRI